MLRRPASISTLRPREPAELSGCPELDCLRGVLAPNLLRAAAARARTVGATADRVLIDWNLIDDEAYTRRLARYLMLPFEDFRGFGRSDCLISDDQFRHAASSGLLPLRERGRIVLVIAPRHGLLQALARRPAAADTSDIRLTTERRFSAFLQQVAGDALADHAVSGLRRRFPGQSAAPQRTDMSGPGDRLRVAGCALAILSPLLVLPLLQVAWASIVLSSAFLAFAALRLAGCCAGPGTQPRSHRIADRDLPVYSVIAGLYREASAVGKLLRFITALDYPPEKLQIILALERDDLATRAAIARLGPIGNLEIVLAPVAGPRTKPKALNFALPFVRGSFVAVYDAEDEPEPGQLRDALRAFQMHGPDVACVQASLCITNGADGWLSRSFAAEYAGQFDIFLQGATRLRLPLPLGGSSNHFRTDALRASGAWDPYNVTEDADLGLRLARLGWRSVMFPSTTREEAPAFLKAWLRQRTRWMKGWMQTWAVHMRAPLRLYRDIGLRGLVSINLLVGGNVLGALAYPCLLGTLAFKIADYAGGHRPALLQDWSDCLHLAAAVSGFLVTIGTGLAGLRRRGLLRHAWVLALTPLYWMALSAAAWRALWQLICDPYKWEKTEHGLAKTHDVAHAQRRHALIPDTGPQRRSLTVRR